MAIKIVQIGIGPLGRMVTQHIADRGNMRVVGAVDTDQKLVGMTLADLCSLSSQQVTVSSTLDDVLNKQQPDVAVLTTVSDIRRIAHQIEDIIDHGLPVVTTCEELVFPWKTAPEYAEHIDRLAKQKGVTVFSTGVNPGFLMDTLPVILTGICSKVKAIRVSRIQNASTRRLPFQQKIGAGLSLQEFDEKKKKGTLRHVGLTESMHMIAAAIGWELDRTEDEINPIVAERTIETEQIRIESGIVAGVQQIGRGFSGSEEKITLIFRASLGESDPQDTIEIFGEPDIVSTIIRGVNGDIATCAIILNAVPLILKVEPGLKTMIDLPVLTYSLAGK